MPPNGGDRSRIGIAIVVTGIVRDLALGNPRARAITRCQILRRS